MDERKSAIRSLFIFVGLGVVAALVAMAAVMFGGGSPASATIARVQMPAAVLDTTGDTTVAPRSQAPPSRGTC